MSDIYELMVTVDLRDELSEQQVAELRWHLGLGPQPERLTVVADFPVAVVDDDGHPAVENDPRPLLAADGPAWKVGGVLGAALAARTDPPRRGWSVTARAELHPDDSEQVGELLCWLAERAHDTHRLADGAVRLGYYRWHEDLTPYPLKVTNGRPSLPLA
ncbi:hypothetical protein F7Q99_37835 [Streptomyces kaniharaensis]|uniref:Uncharacterized protein n=1 Tax=Streptomyces kaniharaensis TaxID=212423 RepID=A0A6N7L2G4_9ACTN|nr:hypothetical protein [Streptomyces kaniharaensis]MQS17801.1 hypothetical protein [Streptomyces kaniharaensis]